MEDDNIPFDSVVLVDENAYISKLPQNGTSEIQWVLVDDPISTIAKTKERMMGAMLLDEDRNLKYKQAIFDTVKKDSVVFDAGSGTGLLSLFAAQAGAKPVYACEMNPLMYKLSEQVIIDNN